MIDPAPFKMVLAKEDFKFSTAHFTLFGPREAEWLHGHNYRVRVELAGESLNEEGLLADIAKIKIVIRRLCARLDSKTLIPSESRHLEIGRQEGGYTIDCMGRHYRLPEEDVVVLPLVNTSIELLARWFWQQLVAQIELERLVAVSVEVAETSGQSCAYRAAVP